MKKIMVFGTFAILHPGHLNYFKQAKKLGDYLIVIIGRDETVQKIKGRSPQNKEGERLIKVEQQKIVDKALLGNLDDPYKIIKQERPDIIALGYDQNSFSKGLKSKIKKLNLETQIVRLKPFEPEKYESSKLQSSTQL